MSGLKLIIDALFVFSVIFIWLMLLYQFVLTLGGFWLWKKEGRSVKDPPSPDSMPPVSILIPARNEEKVIGALLSSLQELKFPFDKLEIIVINDGSKDKTGEIVLEKAQQDARIRLVNIPSEKSGQGKGHALNTGLEHAQYDTLAVYDADNRPEKESLSRLCAALNSDPELAAVTGKFRAYNRKKNWLTRMINLETLAFQWIIQAGRWQFMRIAFISGTNFLIRRSVLQEIGNWNKQSLVEDSELTFRIYEKGYKVRFLPAAVTWEQEPETLKTWLRQRTRWARGNGHIIRDYGKRLFKARPRKTSLELLNLMYLYYFFIFAILISDLIFFLSLFKLVHIRVLGPYSQLWLLAFLLFILEIMVALAYEKEDSIGSAFWAVLAYFTYTKLWVIVVLRSFYQDLITKREIVWDKTERFDIRTDSSVQKGEK